MGSEIDGVMVHGTFDERFAGTIEQFAGHFSSGKDIGASYALSVDGEMVVDVWAGHLDEAKTREWQEDTIVNVYSSTKTVSFLCALILADRGLLDFDAPVKDYWPEFAAGGKDQVLVWHLMDHAAGLSGMDVPIETGDMYDWEKMTSLLAAQSPWWEPGTASGYHALTQGYLIGEVVRRITGKTIGEFTRDEITTPLAADFFIGTPRSEFHRVGNLIVPEGTNDANRNVDQDQTSIPYRTFANPAPVAQDSWTDDWRLAEIPAANGHGNARALTRIHTALACGGSAFGVDLISPETAASIMQPRIEGTDLVLKVPASFGLGFGLNRGPVPISPNPNACFWGGWGGSSVVIDADAHVVQCFVMNKMFPGLLGDTRSYLIRENAYRDLG